jgi:hypothetical protein
MQIQGLHGPCGHVSHGGLARHGPLPFSFFFSPRHLEFPLGPAHLRAPARPKNLLPVLFV